MRFFTLLIACGMLAAGVFAMADGSRAPGAMAAASETSDIFGAECYMPTATKMMVCSGGIPPSDCTGCGCTLWTWANILESGGGAIRTKTCQINPSCEFNDVDVGRYCYGATKMVGGGEQGPGGEG